jgi:hypothetical protein
MTAVDWSAIDWNDADAEDPNRWTKGYRGWKYYAQPVMQRDDGRTYQPREFHAPTEGAARKIIEASPERRGHIVYWSELTQRRVLIDEVVAS